MPTRFNPAAFKILLFKTLMLKTTMLKIDRCTVSKYAPVAQISYCVMSQTVEFTGDAGIAIRKCL